LHVDVHFLARQLLSVGAKNRHQTDEYNSGVSANSRLPRQRTQITASCYQPEFFQRHLAPVRLRTVIRRPFLVAGRLLRKPVCAPRLSLQARCNQQAGESHPQFRSAIARHILNLNVLLRCSISFWWFSASSLARSASLAAASRSCLTISPSRLDCAAVVT
jgi:hypothetical protein